MKLIRLFLFIIALLVGLAALVHAGMAEKGKAVHKDETHCLSIFPMAPLFKF